MSHASIINKCNRQLIQKNENYQFYREEEHCYLSICACAYAWLKKVLSDKLFYLFKERKKYFKLEYQRKQKANVQNVCDITENGFT